MSDDGELSKRQLEWVDGLPGNVGACDGIVLGALRAESPVMYQIGDHDYWGTWYGGRETGWHREGGRSDGERIDDSRRHFASLWLRIRWALHLHRRGAAR